MHHQVSEQGQVFFPVTSEKLNKDDKGTRDEKSRGLEEPTIRIIRNKAEIESTYLQLVNQAREQILLILPSMNAYSRQSKIGMMDALMRAAASRGVSVSILAPDHNARDAIHAFNSSSRGKKIDYKSILEATTSGTVTVLVVDRTSSMIIEVQNDASLNFSEATGVAT